MVHKEKQVNVNFNLNQLNSWYISYNQYIQNKLHIKAMNYACFKLEEKATRSVENRDESEKFQFSWKYLQDFK